MNSRNTLLPVVVLASALMLAWVHHHQALPPVPIAANAPAEVFSAVRAFDVLTDLLQENQPHPVGSTANKFVRSRIEHHLSSMNIPYRIQATWACRHQSNRCAPIENIIATLGDKSNTTQIAVMAHYDSVPTSVGAGDDGMAVAAILESARALTQSPRKDRSLLLIFTDGEENGLLGAEAFFAEAPEAPAITTVLNFEGSGTKGVSRLLRTSDNNAELIKRFGIVADPAVGSSLSNEIFKRMPNDTDFSTVLRYGKQGLDFAFAQERTHYHTRNDNLANIDMRTLQHHGNNMLPLLKNLLQDDVAIVESRNLSYTDFYGFWLSWPSDWQLAMALAALTLLLGAIISARIRFGQLLLGFIAALVVLIGASLTCFAGFRAIEFFAGPVPSWPANDLAFRVYVIASVLGTGSILALFAGRWVSGQSILFGAWLWVTLLSLVTTVLMPSAANNWLMAALPASLLLFASTKLSSKHHVLIIPLTGVFAIPGTLGLFLPIETSQGYQLLPALFPSISVFTMLYVSILLGLECKSSLKPLGIVGVCISLCAAVFAIHTPMYTEARPRLLNLYLLTDQDANRAWITARGNTEFAPRLADRANFDTTPKQLLPFQSRQYRHWAEVRPPNFEQVGIVRTSEPVDYQNQPDSAGKTIEFTIAPMQATSQIRWYWPADIELRNFRLNGKEFAGAPAPASANAPSNSLKFQSLTLYGVSQKHLKISLNFNTRDVFEGYFVQVAELPPPELQHFIAAKGAQTASVHQGDQALSFRTVKF